MTSRPEMNAVWQYNSKKGSIGDGAYFPYYYSGYYPPNAKRQSFASRCSQYDKVTGSAPFGAGERPENQEVLDVEHDCEKSKCQRIIINVSGQRFETQLRTLNRYPDTLLGDEDKRNKFWDKKRSEFFIDRHRPSFQAVLYFYQSGGRLRRPIEVPEDIFLEELEFYQLSEQTIREYKEKEGFIMEVVKDLPTNKCHRQIWLLCEEPDSSKLARAFAIVSVICIVISIINFCVETVPAMARAHCVNVTLDGGLTYVLRPNYEDAFFVIECVCVTWFSLEFLLRIFSCPNKLAFCKNVMNIFDLLAILPFFISIVQNSLSERCGEGSTEGSFIVIRVLRVFRIFKLSKHSQGLRILGLTIKTSLRELGMFFFFLIVAMVIFSSAAYYAEMGEPESQLKSIPGAFWWAIVTMTTVGYGDVTPVGVWGRLVGTLCVIAGVLTIALPVPVVVANFNNFYRHESGRGYISA